MQIDGYKKTMFMCKTDEAKEIVGSNAYGAALAEKYRLPFSGISMKLHIAIK